MKDDNPNPRQAPDQGIVSSLTFYTVCRVFGHTRGTSTPSHQTCGRCSAIRFTDWRNHPNWKYPGIKEK